MEFILTVQVDRLEELIKEQAWYSSSEREVRSLLNELQLVVALVEESAHSRRSFVEETEVRKLCYQAEDIVDEWSYAILKHKVEKHPNQKVCSFIPSSSCLLFKKVDIRRDIAKKIFDDTTNFSNSVNVMFGILRNRINVSPKAEIFRDRSTSTMDLVEIQGRDRDRDILVSKLMNNSGAQEESTSIPILAIVGMAGLGKTTLAQLVYNDSRVEKSFELRIWICFSYSVDLVVIAKEILESIEKESSPDTDELSVLLDHVEDSFRGKRFLVVLDDVWINNYHEWKPLEKTLRSGGAGSMVLMTTRDEGVVHKMASRDTEVFRLELLSDEDCWSLLCSRYLSERNEVEFEEIGKNIVKKCNGLPLAVKTLGRVLQSMSLLEGWEAVFNCEIWQMPGAKADIFSHFLLSYDRLPYTLRCCFDYCAMFPKDTKIDVENLIGNWMALGYVTASTGIRYEMDGLYGRECLDKLVEVSLLQVLEKDDFDEVLSCKMHYIVHDFAQYLSEAKTCQTCEASTINEFSTLYCDKETSPKLCDCLARLRVLSFTNCGLRFIPQGMEKMIHLRWLNVTGATELSPEHLKIIFRLYHLQSLTLLNCGLKLIPVEIGSLIHLTRLELSGNESLIELPREIGNLIHLRRLDLSGNKSLKELPREICNLVQLRRLDLSGNKSLTELPQEIGNLIHLSRLDLSGNESLEKLPESICGLKKLETLNNLGCKSFCRLPVRVTQLTGPRAMNEFRGGNGWCKLSLLKNLNHLDGFLWLRIRVDADCNLAEMVEDARKAELRNKSHVQGIRIHFDESSSSEDVLDALQTHPNLRELAILNYEGSKLPTWMVNPLNHLTNLSLHFCNHLTSLPPLGKLPCLEEIYIDLMESLETVGQEFLGLTAGEGGAEDIVVFPKLKTLELRDCNKWRVWEDITTEEEESAAFSAMPCLTKLTITGCNGLTMLPHRLLSKASSLDTLRISGSTQLVERYEKMDGSDWKSISKERDGVITKT